jgi:hypothetical protein
MENPLKGLIGSATRVKLLMRLFLNPHARSYLRELAREFSVSTNAVREELNQLSRTDLLKVEKEGRNVFYSANTEHPIYPELRSMVQKVMGIDQVIDGIITRLGTVESAFLIDDYAEGKDSGIIDIVLIGRINQSNLQQLIIKTEGYIGRKIRPLVLTHDDFAKTYSTSLAHRPQVIIWKNDNIPSKDAKCHHATRGAKP